MLRMPKEFKLRGDRSNQKNLISSLVRELDRFFRYIRSDLEVLDSRGGASGTFTSSDGKTVTVANGLITSIEGP